MCLAVAILSLPRASPTDIKSRSVLVVRLLGGAADRDLDHRNSPGRNPKCSREAASQAGFGSFGPVPGTVPRTRDSPQVAARRAFSSANANAAQIDDRLAAL